MSTESPASASPVRVVFDTNVLISAAIDGIQAEHALYLIADGVLIGFTSASILAETQKKLVQKFHRSTEECELFIRSLLKVLELVDPVSVEVPQLRDPGDLHVICTAVAANANLIITTDPDLLTLKRYKKIGIIHPKTLRWTFPDTGR